ncbi:MAG: Uroporphyrinogen decarboxylase [Alphaproteobacteria bacterium MarineAlpha12_Bin1]|nr:MAG: Uroporphyrinogen decarboxylase [Alphaproteobacteria bacterium MarineAlpha12_Bin1]
MSKLILLSLEGKILPRPPFWFMRQAGRYLPEYRDIRKRTTSFLDLCYQPEIAAEITLQPVHRFHPDAAILFSDILVIPHALGQMVEFKESIGPCLNPVRTTKDLKGLSLINCDKKLSPIFETVKLVKEKIPEDVALIGFAGSPWTVATYMVEGGTSRNFVSIKKWARNDPNSFSKLINLIVDSTCDYIVGQVESGADVIQLFDTWASVVPADQFQKLIIEPTQRIINRVRQIKPKTKFIGFPKGIGTAISHYAEETGVNCLSIDSSVSPKFAANCLQPKFAIQGNLDPIALLVGGNSMLNSTSNIINTLNKGPFIFNLGHGIIPETPPENVEILANFIRSGGKG